MMPDTSPQIHHKCTDPVPPLPTTETYPQDIIAFAHSSETPRQFPLIKQVYTSNPNLQARPSGLGRGTCLVA